MANQKNGSQLPKWLFLLILVCFFFSGMTGLIYQVIWTRMVVKVIGAAPFAITIILTVFMGGLGIGSYLASRYIDKIRNTVKLVKIYGILELIIGAYCLVLPFIIMLLKPLFATAYNQLFQYFWLYNFVTFLFCGLILIIPVICMGATLPILCRFYVSNISQLGSSIGRLYGLNTIGAAVGALITGFWLIEAFGVNGTIGVAVVVNVVIGVVCIFVAQLLRHSNSTVLSASGNASSVTKSNATQLSPEASAARKTVRFLCLLVFAVSGFCAMSYEVIWTKLLGLIIGPTTYSFSIVLVTFITGLALGSILFGWIVDRVKKPMVLLIYTQISAAVIALVVTHYMGNSQFLFAKIIYEYQDNFLVVHLIKAAILFGFMLLPTICLGATFPIVGKVYTESLDEVGNAVGFSYAINTIGAVLGSFCAGFILVPYIGKENGIKCTVLLQMLVAIFVIVRMNSVKRADEGRNIFGFALAIVGCLLCIVFPSWDTVSLSYGRYHRLGNLEKDIEKASWLESFIKGSTIISDKQYGEVVYYGDGLAGFTSVMKYRDLYGNTDLNIIVSGKPDASTRTDMPTQTLSAHYPMLFHPNPKSVMVIGLASGITAGEALHYDLERLDVLEISKEVVKGSAYFDPWNNEVLKHPVTELILQDGRAHMQLTKRKYDVIISEPSNPWMAGLAALFTEDYFSAAKTCLNQDGIFAQFIHSYQMEWDSFAMVCRSFASVYKNANLVKTRTGDYLMIGFNDPKAYLNIDYAKRNMKYAQKSTNINIVNEKTLYQCVMTTNLTRLAGEGKVHSDKTPYLEFLAPRGMYTNTHEITDNLVKQEMSPYVAKFKFALKNQVDLQLDYLEMNMSVNTMDASPVNWPVANQTQRGRYYKLVTEFAKHNKTPFEIIEEISIRKSAKREQALSILESIDDYPIKSFAYYNAGDLYRENGNYPAAQQNYLEALKLKPGHAELYNDLAITYHYQGNLKEAIGYYDKAIALKPDYENALNNRQKAQLSLNNR